MKYDCYVIWLLWNMTVMKYDCHLIWLLFNTTIVQYECCAIWPPAFLLFTSMPPLMSWVFYKQCRPPVVITDQLQDVIYCRVPKRVCIYILRSVKQTFGTFGSVKGLYLCQKVCKIGVFHKLMIIIACWLMKIVTNSLAHYLTCHFRHFNW